MSQAQARELQSKASESSAEAEREQATQTSELLVEPAFPLNLQSPLWERVGKCVALEYVFESIVDAVEVYDEATVQGFLAEDRLLREAIYEIGAHVAFSQSWAERQVR